MCNAVGYSVAKAQGSIKLTTHMVCILRVFACALPCKGWEGNRQSIILDLLFLTPLSVAVSGRLQLGAAHWATSVTLMQVVYN